MARFKILITGANGLIGKYFRNIYANEDIIPIEINNGKASWPVINEKCHIVLLHLAWRSIPSLPTNECEKLGIDDYQMTMNLFKTFTRRYYSESIIFVSTAGDIYRKSVPILCNEKTEASPNSPYSYYKLLIEKELSNMNIDSLSLRVSNAWGCKIKENRRNGFIDKAIHNAMTGINTLVTIPTESVISIIHIRDLCSALYKACYHIYINSIYNERKQLKEKYNLSGEYIEINQIIKTLTSLTEAKIDFQPTNNKSIYTLIDASLISKDLNWNPSNYFNKKTVLECCKHYASDF
ncbi:NAD-dependent epimerase/dehydratase family protein [Synechococcus sp. HB1133]|uniref:NAD-dependent epimerase/dehydratase family protein n=1 Tax=unclassified Synechococcus TaxID=2626047 RepID=UPI00140AF746|nr:MULTISPECIES: NAD-dependent epimerase/dehydratase family protein [unclassified Synechococcus]MCB4421477.1 NAD-dependent epimerase/dehydratase family protein [Synechococcus sp. HB1133]MCB4431171.1 NAD-dependent epimerase/dehydratase family protein [Synechococcus sp. HBA1120]NHI80420.1 NAD-dependent epimerase/dehydratase family protein [Synechococcus sp. HB1133]